MGDTRQVQRYAGNSYRGALIETPLSGTVSASCINPVYSRSKTTNGG